MKKKITFAFLLLAMQINAQCWESISADVVHKVAIKSDGTLWAWGGNYSGSLIGTETPVNITSPTQIGTETNWQYVTTGYAYTLATKTDGTLWAWGGNRGQLGDGTTIMRINPVQVGTDVNWASVSAGYNHVLALKTDGTLWAWGMNAYGQLGDGTTIDKFVPIQIGTDTNWTLVSAGGVDTIDFSIALKIDGTLWAWGNNARSGQLGDGTTIDRNIPTQIGTDTNWQDAYAGGLHTIALKTDGTLWAWGENQDGQLGDGTNIDRHAPTLVGNDVNWQSVSSKGNASAALKTDGTLWTWGSNSSGQLGDGTITNRNVPVNIGNATNWDHVSVGGDSVTVLNTSGELWVCGENRWGQLGDGTTEDQYSLVQVICSALNVGKITNTKFALYPNPVSNNLNISNPLNLPLQSVTITDVSGNTIFTQQGNIINVEVTHLHSGVYFLRILSGNNVQIQKFIKL